MTKTKQQLRAEAVERLTELNEHGYWKFPVHVALCGRDVPNVDEERTIIADLLTDDCGPCYACAKLAELRAENNALREIVGDIEAPTDAGEASMASVEAFIEKQTEHEQDTREKLEEDILNAGHDNSTEEIFGWLDRQAAIDRKEFQTILEEIQKCVRSGSR